MPSVHRKLLSLLACCLLLPATTAWGQLPTAAGRQFALSNSAWKVFIPNTYQQRTGNMADVLVHFHGDPQTLWNNAKYANLNAIIVTVNYSGLSSAYETPFSNAALFQQVVDEALAKVRAQADFADTLTWDKLGVSSFSAGYGAVRQILKNPAYRSDIDALLAADSLYAAKAGDGTPSDAQMADYKTFASLAKTGQKTFLYSHSQVPTSYSSTLDCGNELMASLGISASAYNVNGLGDLDFYRHVKSGNFELWGAMGADGDSHLEHLRYVGEFLQHLPLAKLTDFAADFNNDGAVNATDLSIWRGAFGSTTTAGDANGDGRTDGRDFLLWQQQRGLAPAGVGAATAVPEPAGIAAAIVALGATCLRRRPLDAGAPRL